MQATIQYIKDELSGYYPETEIQSFVRLIIEHVCNMSFTRFILRKNELLNPSVKIKVREIVERLKKSEPIQYILGETEFFGMRLKVAPGVLIPRPETEELVQWIINLNRLKDPSILDIGTGSGCIALALKKNIGAATVSAVDVSEEALGIAESNASMHNLNVNFFRADILNFRKYNWQQYNIIVSNPPYVRELEKIQMEKNVLQYEPANALFVPDDDPLLYYRFIKDCSAKYLQKNGLIFFEINEKFGNDLAILFEKSGFKNIEVAKDIHGKNRFLKCTKQ
jgi:release factor glutamine methyltransferase